MDDHELPIGRRLHIELDAVRAQLDGPQEGDHGVLRADRRCTSMSHDLHNAVEPHEHTHEVFAATLLATTSDE
jgi:hypothetical protein